MIINQKLAGKHFGKMVDGEGRGGEERRGEEREGERVRNGFQRCNGSIKKLTGLVLDSF